MQIIPFAKHRRKLTYTEIPKLTQQPQVLGDLVTHKLVNSIEDNVPKPYSLLLSNVEIVPEFHSSSVFFTFTKPSQFETEPTESIEIMGEEGCECRPLGFLIGLPFALVALIISLVGAVIWVLGYVFLSQFFLIFLHLVILLLLLLSEKTNIIWIHIELLVPMLHLLRGIGQFGCESCEASGKSS
ncbi:unnamed protein product [Sphenostylis stenocarpa]|uniref:Uncharacterized protein n=1 Tax=Sphenostylis stenocarpa TaxID=92480 RepID=A0AA86SFG0_9FABA|nr:unnamed protein product [Sphenostylis stenocarpa]